MAAGTPDDARTIGRRLREVRIWRRKSLKVVAELAGISEGYLSKLERGQSPIERRSLIVALANALEIAPSELIRLPMPAPGNGHVDSVIEQVRRVLVAVDLGRPNGLVVPVDALRDRVARIQDMRRRCLFGEVADDLPGLVRDLHTTLAAATTTDDRNELLPLAVFTHVQVTGMWLYDAGAPVDLQHEVASMARRLALEHGEAYTLGMAALATIGGPISSGQYDLAQAELDSLTLPDTTSDTASLLGLLTLAHASIAVADNRPGDVAAPTEAANELAQRFGEYGEDPLGFAFGPTHVGWHRMKFALETGEPDRAVGIAEGVRPERHPFVTCQAAYWTDFGRAAAQLPERRDDAVRALRTAEDLFPVRTYRNPFARDAVAELLGRSRRDAGGRELRGLAYRMGLAN
jgi:transcriptional regulator with XRE-family HTH domain